MEGLNVSLFEKGLRPMCSLLAVNVGLNVSLFEKGLRRVHPIWAASFGVFECFPV